MINITEEQKKILEVNGYMVIEFKLWCKKLTEQLSDLGDRIVDAGIAMIQFLEDIIFKTFDRVKELARMILDKCRPFIDEGRMEYGCETRIKHPFVRSLGRKYGFSYMRVKVYHCRNNC